MCYNIRDTLFGADMGKKMAVTYSQFTSHEKLFQLPSTRVILSKCKRWKQKLETPATAWNVSNVLSVTSSDSGSKARREDYFESNKKGRAFCWESLLSGSHKRNFPYCISLQFITSLSFNIPADITCQLSWYLNGNWGSQQTFICLQKACLYLNTL